MDNSKEQEAGTVKVKKEPASTATPIQEHSPPPNHVRIKSEPEPQLSGSETSENVATATHSNGGGNATTTNVENATGNRLNVQQKIPQQDVAVAMAEVSTNSTNVNINDDFFSDLIDEPPPPPPLENLPVEQLEEKFANKLRELQELDAEKTPNNNQEQTDRAQKRQLPDNEQNAVEKRPRVGQIRVASADNLFEKPSTSLDAAAASARVKSEFGIAAANNSTLEFLPVIHYNRQQPSNNKNSTNKTPVDPSRVKYENVFNEMENFADGVDISPKLKREMALKRVAATKELFKKHAKGIVEILHTDTVRKLPSNASYLTQQFYDNRSPLHTTNNVQFKFNSPFTDIKLEEWGLQSLSPVTAHIARVIGFDVYVLNFKLGITEISKYLPGQHQRPHGLDENAELAATGSSIFINATTQTMLIGPVFNKPPKKDTNTVPTQTEAAAEFQDSAAGLSLSRVQNFPFLKQLNNLNENQLLALNDFVELMQQQDIAADVYRLRECLLRIFHRSQLAPIVNQQTMYIQAQPTIPHVPNQMIMQQQVPPPPPPIFEHDIANHARNFMPSQQQQHHVNNYTSSPHHRAKQMLQPQPQEQQNLKSSTYPRTARNDPRLRQNKRF